MELAMGNEVKLVRLTCESTEDEGEDELYLIHNGENVWSGAMNVGQSRDLGIVRPIHGQSVVDLFDEDWPDSDDFLGRVVIPEGEVGQGEKTQVFPLDEAHYTLYYKVREE
jgi:hypothetical protein